MLRRVAQIVASILLCFNGIGAFYGGISFITDPINGGSLQMPLDYLQHSPFADFFIPGLILLVANGIGSFLALAAMLCRWRVAYWLLMLQGVILSGWILVQIILLRTFDTLLHTTFLTIGIVLLLLGWYLQKNTPTSMAAQN